MTRRNLLRYAGIGAFGGVITSALGDLSVGNLELTRSELKLSNWDADGFRLAVLSDFHANSKEEADRARRACQMAVAEKPDAILIPGDFVNLPVRGPFNVLRSAVEPLANASCPVLATFGNHDYSAGQTERMGEMLKGIKIQVLRNSMAELDGVSIAGLDDAIYNRMNTEFLNRGYFSRSLIAMLHEPDFGSVLPSIVSLQVSGHSHGGQVCLPGGSPVYLPYGAREFYAGYYPEAKVPLFVTRGVGTTGPRWRLFCRPEVNILTLRTG